MPDQYDFVGHTRMLVDIGGGSPFARCVIYADLNHEAVLEAIRAGIRKAFTDQCLHVKFSDDRLGLTLADLTFGSKPETIKTKAEEDAAWEQNREELGKIFRESDQNRVANFAKNPDNGKHGYWHVEGVRHDGFVQASSEAEAVAKAIDSGTVGDWESPTASYVGEHPEVLG